MSSDTVVLSKENVNFARMAFQHALLSGKQPTFQWAGEAIRGIDRLQICKVEALDRDGDLVVVAGGRRVTLRTETVLDGEVEIGISEGKMKEYAQAQLKAMKEAMQSGLALFNEEHTFSPGQFIQWKPGMKTARVPEYDYPVIVIEVLDNPKQHSLETCNNHSPAVLDLVIGMVLDGVFQHHYADSRRFMPHK